jgi:hypothetical protein
MASYRAVVSTLTKVIPAAATTKISRKPGGTTTLTLAQGAAPVKPGQILVSGPTSQAPDGYLLKATAVTSRGGVQTVTATPATLYQALPAGSFDYRGRLTPVTKGAALTNPSAWRWQQGSGASSPHGAMLRAPFSGVSWSCGGGAKLVSVSGSVSFSPYINFSSQWGWQWLPPFYWIQSATLGIGFTEAASVQLTGGAEAQCGTKTPLTVASIPLPTIAFSIGPVPVVITLTLNINLSAKASLTMAGTISMKQQASAFAGVTDQGGNISGTSWWNGSSVSDMEQIKGTLSAEADIMPTLVTALYGAAGPSIDVGAGVVGSASVGNPQPEPWWTVQGCLFAGATGLVVPVLGWKLGDFPQLIKKCWTVAQGGSATVPKPPVISTASLPGATEGGAYSTQLSAQNGTAPLTWTATGLPAGMSVNLGSGVISGTPLQSGSFSVKVTLTDSQIPNRSVSRSYTLTVKAAPPLKLASATLSGSVGLPFSGSLIATGGLAPYSWTATGLPSGWSINSGTGQITGTFPAAPTVIDIRVGVSDHGIPPLTATGTMVIDVAAGVGVTTTSLAAGTQGIAYAGGVAAAGGTAPYTWSATGLPAGLSINPGTGDITGTPTAGGTFSVTVSVHDSAATPTTAKATLPLTIYGGITVTPGPSNVAGGAVPSWYITELPCSSCWTLPMNASGGSGSYTWTLSNARYGVSIDPVSGVVTDDQLNVGPGPYNTVTMTITATDNADPQDSASYSITLAPATGIPT